MQLRIGIIGGTGLGEALVDAMEPVGIQSIAPETPFGPPSAPLVLGRVDGVEVALLKRHGHGHRFNPSHVPYAANVWALKAVGCTHVVASGACGSLRESIHPGDLLLVDQMLDRTVGRSRSLFGQAAVHVEFADPCCPVMREWLLLAAEVQPTPTLHPRGGYVCIEGPGFSTRLEAAMHRALGCDVVGMTGLPEARLVREAEMGYALIALPTDYDCWRARDSSTSTTLLEEIRANLRRAVDGCVHLVRAALRDVSVLRERPSPAHRALELAVWSAQDAITPEDQATLEWLAARRVGVR